MLKSKFDWQLPDNKTFTSVDSGLHPEIERLFLTRLGGVDIDVWHDPFSFSTMHIVVDRINLAITNNEKILIYGDYDADGTTATAILMRALQKLEADVQFYIPNRFSDGYGPNMAKFQTFVNDGYQLIITVDCGISAVDEAQLLKDNNVDYIITDHHHLKGDVPPAFAIIHPEIDEQYPFDYLAGAGVALKIAIALLGDDIEEDDYLLAMLGTVGDIVTLTDENRTIVKRGLEALHKTSLPSVCALLRIADENQYESDEKTVGFAICPRLNAPGRMDDANLVVDLLLATDDEEASEIAEEVDYWNNLRKQVTDDIATAALEMVEKKDLSKQKAVVLHDASWHQGVLGIVASRIVDRFGIATVVLATNEDGELKGSARAPEGFDILQALITNETLLKRYGGHAGAAGMTLATNDPAELETGLNDALAKSQATRAIKVDLDLPLAELDLKWYNDLGKLAPFGQGNPRPVIKLADVEIKTVKPVGNKEHLKFTIYDDVHEFDAIFFSGANHFIYLTPNTKFDILAEVELNEWNGHKKLQLRIIDLACNQVQVLDLRNRDLDTKFSPLVTDGFVIDKSYPSKTDLQVAFRESGAQNVVLKPLNALTMPSREQFVLVYKDIKTHAPFTLTPAHVAYFAKNRIPHAMLLFIIRVFDEIGLLKYDDGTIQLLPYEGKVDYENALSYISRREKVTVHEFLDMSSPQEILEFLAE